ncbi:MAG: DUF4974 domain-containing protein [Deltaproteobacteria bacterium]|nr:DUF4974 domain-containing protein [Deltaproteobacteria bacterium]
MAEFEFDTEKIKKFFEGVYSDRDLTYVNDVFCNKTKEEELKKLLKKQWYDLFQKKEGSDKDLSRILYRIHYEINTNSSGMNKLWSLNPIVRWSTRFAAILFIPLLIFSGIHFLRPAKNVNSAWVEIKAPAWTRAQFSLPDGTTGWLNSNSSIKYDSDFRSGRQVNLKGEALFDVFKDQKNPFSVITDKVCVKALGTRFNIASYETEKDVEIVLEEGKLLIEQTNRDKSLTINPNELVIYNKTLENFSVEKVLPQKYLSWTEGKLIFRNDPLDIVARRLERWFNVDVEIRGEIKSDLRLRATFVDESLEEVMQMLKRSLPIKYTIEDRIVDYDGTYTRKKVTITRKL